MAAKYTPEGDGIAGECWNLKFDVVQSICTEFGGLFSRPLSNQTDVRIALSDSVLTARLTPGS